MNKALTFHLTPKPVASDIVVGNGIVLTEAFAERCRKLSTKVAIITDMTLEPIYGHPLERFLKDCGLTAHLFSFPYGEKNKNRKTKALIEDRMLSYGYGRDCMIISLGGGVVSDIAGFIASTFCRGVPLVLVPTSLLAMVDASIGGKNGVNALRGKNLIGTIYQPAAVVIDTSFLKTVKVHGIREGAVEMLKHGFVADPDYFAFLESHAKAIMNKEIDLLEKAIYRSCAIKKSIVEEDEHEYGKRRLINFGHTVGHALEAATYYEMSHGEAVAVGCLVESRLSQSLGYLKDESLLERLEKAFDAFQVNMWKGVHFSVDDIVNIMSSDKKAVAGVPRFVIIKEVGSVEPFDGQYCTTIEPALIHQALAWINSR